jgi:methylmalonyl-CoA mutase
MNWPAKGLGAYRGSRGARRHGQGDRSGPAEAADRGGRGAHPGAHRFRRADGRRRQQATGPGRKNRSTCSWVDNAAVRKLQIDKLKRLRAERDEAAVEAALDALTKAAETGEGNLLAARGRCGAREGDGRRDFLGAGKGLGPACAPRSRTLTGVYLKGGGSHERCGRPRARSSGLRGRGRPPAAHPGRQGRPGRPRPRPEGDRQSPLPISASTSTSAPLFSTPEEAARQAIENDVHIVGISSLAARI